MISTIVYAPLVKLGASDNLHYRNRSGSYGDKMRQQKNTAGELEISPKAAENFDRMLAALCREMARREFSLVAAALRLVERAERGGTPLAVAEAQEHLGTADAVLAQRIRRISLCIASSRVECGGRGCEGHRALFVGVA